MTLPTPIPPTPLTADERRQLGRLYESDHDAVLRLCARILRDPEDAADACQEVFISASREFVAGRLPDNQRGWLLAVARNHCLDVLRRQKRFGKILTTMGNALEDAVNPEATVIGRQSVGSILQGLSPRERQALWQSAVERRTVADIANGMRLNYMAAAQVLSRARRHAALAMARVAAILLGWRVFRNLVRSGGATRTIILAHSAKLAAIAVVPVVIASTQSSSGAALDRVAVSTGSILIAPAGGLIVASTDHRGYGSGTALAAGHLVRSFNLPIGGPAAVPSTVNSTIEGLASSLPSIARGLPPLPVVPLNPTPAAIPKVP